MYMIVKFEMITKIKLINIPIMSHSHHFLVCGGREHLRLSEFQVHDTLSLTVVAMLYTWSPGLIRLVTKGLYPWINISPFPPTPGLW